MPEVGSKVVFHSLMGGWSTLNGLTGVVKEVTDDLLWSHVVQIDYPCFLAVYDLTTFDEKPGRIYNACVHHSALIKLSSLEEILLPLLNRECGVVPSEDQLWKAKWIQEWAIIGELAKQDLQFNLWEKRETT